METITNRRQRRKLKPWVRKALIGGAILFCCFIAFNQVDRMLARTNVNTENEKSLDRLAELKEKDGVEVSAAGWDERKVQNMIHQMTHQKVEADQKWSSIEMTDERVNTLLSVVEENDYDHGDVYKEILTRWAKGDFSQIVEDHNTIWSLQDGNVGKATGKLSASQEQRFINKYFR